MSARPMVQGNLALARPQRAQPAPTPAPRRHLEVAPTRAQRRARPRLAHALVVIGGIVAILVAQLLLSFLLADGAYRITTLQTDQRELAREEQALAEQLELLGSTQNLTANAEILGMVASGNPMFLDLATGAVTGSHSKDGELPENLIPNSLLDGSTVLDPAALAAAAEAEAASGDTGGSTVQGTDPSTTITPGTLPSPTTH